MGGRQVADSVVNIVVVSCVVLVVDSEERNIIYTSDYDTTGKGGGAKIHLNSNLLKKDTSRIITCIVVKINGMIFNS